MPSPSGKSLPAEVGDVFSLDPASARLEPTAAQESAAELRAVQAIAQNLHKAVQACRMYSTDRPPVAFVEHLERGLAAYLPTQRFLRLQITPSAFVFRNIEVLRDTGRDLSLPRLLGGDGLVELLFKEGVTRQELLQLVDALNRAASKLDPSHSPATLLWEADLRHVLFHSDDEFPRAASPPYDIVSLVRESEAGLVHAPEPPEALALDRLLGGASSQMEAMSPVPFEEPAFSAASIGDAFRRPLGQAALKITARERAPETGLALPRMNEAILQLARQLTGIALSGVDEPLAGPARGVLGDLMEALLEQKKMPLARDVVRFLQSSIEGAIEKDDVRIGEKPDQKESGQSAADELFAPAGLLGPGLLDPAGLLAPADLDPAGLGNQTAAREFPLGSPPAAKLAPADTASAIRALLDSVIDRVCKERNVMALGSVLDDPRAEAADARAVREILSMLRENAVDPLCTLLSKLENMQARKLVCQVLAAAAVADPSMLARRAEGEPWYVARNMAYVMGRIGGSRVLPHLRRWTRHPEPRVRIEVSRALGRVRHHAAATILCEMLEDEESRVRRSAVWSLATLGDSRVLTRLRGLLFDERSFRSRRPEERDDFFRTYGRLADEVACQELCKLLQHRSLVGVGWQTELRRGAALALGETGRQEAAELLDRQLGSRDGRLREACASALRSFKNRGLESDAEPGGDWFGKDAGGETEAGRPEVSLEVEDDD